MSFNNIKTNLRSEKGFTIVELLIVIVVIGILAAITIVSFNGVTNKANTTSAKSAASSAIKKAEAHNAEISTYPATPGALVNAATTTTYNLTGVSFSTAVLTAAPSSPATLNFYSCSGNTGTQVAYWDYGTKAWVNMVTGTCTSPTYVGYVAP